MISCRYKLTKRGNQFGVRVGAISTWSIGERTVLLNLNKRCQALAGSRSTHIMREKSGHVFSITSKRTKNFGEVAKESRSPTGILVDNNWKWEKNGNSRPGETLSKNSCCRKQWSIWQRVRNKEKSGRKLTAGTKEGLTEGNLYYPLIERLVNSSNRRVTGVS